MLAGKEEKNPGGVTGERGVGRGRLFFKSFLVWRGSPGGHSGAILSPGWCVNIGDINLTHLHRNADLVLDRIQDVTGPTCRASEGRRQAAAADPVQTTVTGTPIWPVRFQGSSATLPYHPAPRPPNLGLAADRQSALPAPSCIWRDSITRSLDGWRDLGSPPLLPASSRC